MLTGIETPDELRVKNDKAIGMALASGGLLGGWFASAPLLTIGRTMALWLGFDSAITVSRWGKTGELEPGDWVMNGRANIVNWFLSGKWDPNPTNMVAGPSSSEEFVVKMSQLIAPDERVFVFNAVKYLLGQRKFNP